MRNTTLATLALALTSGSLHAAPAQTPHLTQILDVYPASNPTDLTGDDRGDWVFIGEGGMIVFADFRGITSNSDPLTNNPFNDVARLKRVKAGAFGVRPSRLLLDPDAILESVGQTPGTASDDREDILYIAGGFQGLWAMRANTSMTSSARNDVVRIDDSTSGVVTEQESQRFCNELEFVNVDGTDYLMATFGEKAGGSLLRFYKLSDIRDRLDWQPANRPTQLAADGTGYELARQWEVVLDERPGFPFLGGPPLTTSEAWPLGIAVDHLCTDETCLLAIYLAMSSHGLLRVTPIRDPVTNAVTGWATTWGPVFGDGSYYEATSPGSSLYGNLDFYVTGRTVHFDDHDRSEAPVFADVAVENDGSEHWLYCAVDHLNWLRFDLNLPWTASMPIGHHEGEAIIILQEASWHGDGDEDALTSYGSGKEAMRPVDLPPLDAQDPSRRDTTFAHRIALVDPPPGSGLSEKLVVVTSSTLPFLFPGSIRTPTPTYNYTFQKTYGIDFSTAHHLAPIPQFATTIVYKSSSLPGLMNGIGYMTAGGSSLHVPVDQSTAGGSGHLKIVHNVRVENLPEVFGIDSVLESCVSFYDLLTPPTGFAEPVFIRNAASHDAKGRFTNGLGHCISDPRILTSAHNDAYPQMDGILWTRPLNPGPGLALEQAVPTLPGDDRRMETGLVCPQNNQWAKPYPTDPQHDLHYIAGQAKHAGSILTGWGIVEHRVESDPNTPTQDVAWNWTRVFERPDDRWLRRGRDGYISATTSDPAFTAYATAYVAGLGGAATGNEPLDYIFYLQGGTADGVFVIDRSRLMTNYVFANPPANGTITVDQWPSRVSVANQFSLNTHPEWDLIPAATAPNDPSSHWWQPDGAPLEHQGTSTAWPGELIPYPEDVSEHSPPREEWILAVPCFTLSNPHSPTTPLDITGVKTVTVGGQNVIYDLDQEFATWYGGALSLEMITLLENYSHGLVQFWRFTELPAIDYPGTPSGRPPGTSDLPFIVLPDAETSAWRLDWAVVEQGGDSQVLLFVATFGGFLYVYDITDLPDQPRMPYGWAVQNPGTNVLLDTWTAPDGVFRDARLNVRALAIDKIDEDTIHVYAGVPGYGIEALTLDRQGTTTDWAFGGSERIETAGSPHDIEVRPAFPTLGLPKTLLVSDGPAGYRIYGEAP